MSSRRFPDFFAAYLAYVNCGFVPKQFNEWTALCIIAAALERKVFLPWGDMQAVFPNIYVLLVSGAGEGKSTALNRGVRLLEEMNRKTSTVNILPNQATEPAFLNQVGKGRSFTYGTSVVTQNAAFYYASEASACLRNIYNGGSDFIATLTDLYDCPELWRKALKKDGDTPQTLKNVCISLLAGCTFNYLDELVSEKNISGGFASRIVYVVSWDKAVTEQAFQGGLLDDGYTEERRIYREALLADLLAIHQMQGKMRGSPEFARAWETWWYAFEKQRRSYPSEKLKSLLVRTSDNILKVAMLLSAAESNALTLEVRHWEKAHDLVTRCMTDVPDIFRGSRANSTDKSLRNIAPTIMHALKAKPGMSRVDLVSQLTMSGHRTNDVENVLSGMLNSNKVEIASCAPGGSVHLKIVGDPNNYF